MKFAGAGCLLGTFCLLTFVAGIADARQSVESKIRDDVDLSQFYNLLETNQAANGTLMYRGVTVFAPTNYAFQKYKAINQDPNLVLYHMSNQPLRTEQFGTSLTSEFEGNPPLWVTKTKNRDHREEIYINNAKILERDFMSDIFHHGRKKLQVLHKISEVLEPVLFQQNQPSMSFYNPNAAEFLNESEFINLGEHRIRTYKKQVTQHQREKVFSAEGKYTFFIPVDQGFKPLPRANLIDKHVIDGHIIPGHVLFTAPTPSNTPYETLAFGDNVKVTISFSKEPSDKGSREKVYVKSDTLVGDATHPAASVLAEIVKANIPVKNGVVHLIQNPLMVVDSTLYDFIQSWKDREDGPLFKFYEVIRDHMADNLLKTVTRYSNVTLFAPRNAAWDHPEVKVLMQDKARMREILELHVVKEYLPLQAISHKLMRQVATVSPRKNLFFNFAGNHNVTVEGGGVNATIITANIGVTNGVIHIIDKVLGVPFTTVQDKLNSDPILNMTNFLGTRSGFNERLGDTTKRFTFFAPFDRAWQTGEVVHPSTYKKLFMPEYSYQARQILERHLVIADVPLTMKRIHEMSQNKTVTLPAVRDKLRFKIKDAEGYTFEWNGKWVRVVRPDVACTNGIIHVIDSVLLRERDMYVTGGASTLIAIVLPQIMAILVAKWLL